MLSRSNDAPLRLALMGVFLSALLVGCDATGDDQADRGQFTATFSGATNATFKGVAVHESVKGRALLGVLTNFSVRLTDRNWRNTRRAIYFVRRDTSRLAVGSYPLLDLSSDDPARLERGRVWAYISGVGEEFAYSHGGVLHVEEVRGTRLIGTFEFSAAPLSDTSQTRTIQVDGSFESLRR